MKWIQRDVVERAGRKGWIRCGCYLYNIQYCYNMYNTKFTWFLKLIWKITCTVYMYILQSVQISLRPYEPHSHWNIVSVGVISDPTLDLNCDNLFKSESDRLQAVFSSKHDEKLMGYPPENKNVFPGGGNSFFLNFHPEPWRNDPFWRAYFSNGLNHQLENLFCIHTTFSCFGVLDILSCCFDVREHF